ncbi:MAG: hypothetical protein CO108_08225 [Deltaproteobacteria bacterium CG_4_9_14_3_um_filter_63_12]|nr:MAG: hypothetical protein CO108_08225 [Deltaproteobacteria bacterium CG_4_9_14_3_um_filter_63_12]
MNRSLAPSLSLLLLVLMGGLAPTACDDAGSEETRFRFLVYNQTDFGLPDTFPSLKDVRISVVDAADGSLIERFSFSADPGIRHSLDSLPQGESLNFFVEGLDADGNVLASGGSRSLDAAETSQGFSEFLIYVLRIDEFAKVRAPRADESGMVSVNDSLIGGGGRAGHSAVALANGKVLIIGGADLVHPGEGLSGSDIATIHDTVLVYDPLRQTFAPLPSSSGLALRLSAPRVYHTATVLADGRVLVAGGVSSAGEALTTLRSVDVLQPNGRGAFDLVPEQPMALPRAHHTATLRSDGAVLIAGGSHLEGNTEAIQSSAELFDSSANTFYPTQPMSTQRTEHTATLLVDQKSVLIAGGRDATGPLASTEMFWVDPQNRLVFQDTPAMAKARFGHQSLRLAASDGRTVVFAGGFVADADGLGVSPTASVELLDTFDGRFLAEKTMERPRAYFGLIKLARGMDVLAVGGLTPTVGADAGLSDGEVLRFSDAGDDFTSTLLSSSLSSARVRADATLLQNGMVLLSGGVADGTSLYTAELFNPGLPEGNVVRP